MVTPLILLSELKGVVNAKWTDTDAAANVRRVIESASAWLQQACEALGIQCEITGVEYESF